MYVGAWRRTTAGKEIEEQEAEADSGWDDKGFTAGTAEVEGRGRRTETPRPAARPRESALSTHFGKTRIFLTHRQQIKRKKRRIWSFADRSFISFFSLAIKSNHQQRSFFSPVRQPRQARKVLTRGYRSGSDDSTKAILETSERTVHVR